MGKQSKTFATPTEAFISKMQEPTATTSTPEGYTVPEGYRLIKVAKSARLQLLVTPSVAAKLKSAAAGEGLSLNALCNRIFEEYLKGDK